MRVSFKKWTKFIENVNFESLVDRVIEAENLPVKVKQKGFLSFLEAVKYRKVYTKKKLGTKLKENDIHFFENFEYQFPLS